MKQKINIKDIYDDKTNTIDLSVSNLKEVPVKEIATLSKAVILDLSNNSIIKLEKSFAPSFVQLTKIDFSLNEIVELPENFGLLIHLQFLDLYRNKLQTLPLSFCNLKSLRWLDLKDNPLIPSLAQSVGKCEDFETCEMAAKNAIKFIAELSAKAKEKEDIKIREEKQIEELRKQEEEKERQLKKETKKKKKKKNNLKNEELHKMKSTTNGNNTFAPEPTKMNFDLPKAKQTEQHKKSFSFLKANWNILRIITNIIVFSVLSFGFSLFILSLLDENLYKDVLAQVKNNLKFVIAMIPNNIRHTSYYFYTLFIDSIHSIVAVLKVNFLHCWKILHESYFFLTTDKDVQIRLETIKENLHIGYIKTVDSLSIVYSKLLDHISNYIK